MFDTWREEANWDGVDNKTLSVFEYERYFGRIEKVLHQEHIEARAFLSRVIDSHDGYVIQQIITEKHQSKLEEEVDKWIKMMKWSIVERCTAELKERMDSVIVRAQAHAGEHKNDLRKLRYKMENTLSNVVKVPEDVRNKAYADVARAHGLDVREIEVLYLCSTDKLSSLPEVLEIAKKLSEKGMLRSDIGIENVVSTAVLLTKEGWAVLDEVQEMIAQIEVD